MKHTDLASVWHDAMNRAGRINPLRTAAAIAAQADTGLRSTRYDSDGGRTTSVACDDKHCHEGDPEHYPHSHMTTNDPTGNAAVASISGRGSDGTASDRVELARAVDRFVMHAATVLDWVAGTTPSTWHEVRTMNARLMPGTVQSGIDVDEARRLPRAITETAKAVSIIERIDKANHTRTPTQDEQHWTAGLGDNDVCAWHLSIHRRYRRPRLSGKNICADCCTLAELLGQRPPQWLLEAEVDRGAKPRAWQQALGRCMDELGIHRQTA